MLRIFAYLDFYWKKKLIIIILLTLIASFLEILSISAVAPFISLLFLKDTSSLQEVINIIEKYKIFFGFDNILIFYSLIFIGIVLLTGVFRLILNIYTFRFAGKLCSKISKDVFIKNLYQDYEFHLKSNTSKVISSLTQKCNDLLTSIQSFILMITSSFMCVTIILTLFIIKFELAFFALSYFLIIYAITIKYARNKVKKNSYLITNNENNYVKSIQESLQGIREIITYNKEDYFYKNYKDSVDTVFLRKASNSIFTISPRFIIEALGIILISLIAIYFELTTNDTSILLPFLGSLALGAQKLYPIVNLIYSSYTSLVSRRDNINQIYESLILDLKIRKDTNLSFQRNIKIKDLYFKYNKNDQNFILNKINIEIKKGEKIGIIGETGSGKSTLADILIGLLKPSKGKIFIDDKLLDIKKIDFWKNNFSIVSQNIFLTDDSIKRNIAFGEDEKNIDEKLLIKALEISELKSYVYQLENGIETVVGERGIKLSGGQKQRIVIARAIYQNRPILVFDEATSALDIKTEEKIIKSIVKEYNDTTIIIISHRPSFIKICNKVFQIKNGLIEY